jgi:hypothetical protein
VIDEVTKGVISAGTTEQLHKTFEGLVQAMAFRSAQGLGTDRALSEMSAEIVAEINKRRIRRSLRS